MKTFRVRLKYMGSFIIIGLIFAIISCRTSPDKKSLTFKDFPNLKLGFSTQNFLRALPFNVTGLTEIIEYASKEGYDFIEVRDQFVDLSINDCKEIAEVARKKEIDIIYVFNINPLDTEFYNFFEKALANVLVFPGPGILRTLVSKSEFDADSDKKGWTKDEFTQLTRISDSCALICQSKNIRLIFENGNEAFFGDSLTYYGLADFFNNTTGTGLQLDIANLFRNTSRTQNDPERVLKYLPSLRDRWVETHLKTVLNGEPQPVLTENPLPVAKVIEMMGKQNVIYVALELNALGDKQQCFDNHTYSIQFLKEKGILF